MSADGVSMDGLVILGVGIACVATIFDLAGRYVLKSRKTKKIEQHTVETQTDYDSDVLSDTEGGLRARDDPLGSSDTCISDTPDTTDTTDTEKMMNREPQGYLSRFSKHTEKTQVNSSPKQEALPEIRASDFNTPKTSLTVNKDGATHPDSQPRGTRAKSPTPPRREPSHKGSLLRDVLTTKRDDVTQSSQSSKVTPPRWNEVAHHFEPSKTEVSVPKWEDIARKSAAKQNFLTLQPEDLNRLTASQQDLLSLDDTEIAQLAQEGPNSEELEQGTEDMLNDLDEAMRTNIQLTSKIKVDGVPRRFKDQLESIRKIHNGFDTLSEKINDKAVTLLDQEEYHDRPEVDLVSENDQGGNNAFASLLRRRAHLRCQWLGLRRLLFCADLQLRNAATYHMFFDDARELKRLLLDIHKDLEAKEKELENEDLIGQVDLEEVQKMSDYFNMLHTNVQDVVTRSPRIVPVRLRKARMKDQLPIRCIASLSTDKFDVSEGETLILIDNRNPHSWRVENASGIRAEIPSVCCVIPPPDNEALIVAARLHKALTALMSRYLETTRAKLLRYCSNVVGPMVNESDPLLKKLTSPTKTGLLDDIHDLADLSETLFSTLTGYPKLEEMETNLEVNVSKATIGRTEDSRVKTDISEPIQDLNRMLGTVQDMNKRKQAAKSFALSRGLEQYINDEGSLDWVAVIVKGLDDTDGLSISVQHQETEVAETSSFTSWTGEVRHKMSAQAVIDPRTNRPMSLEEAVDKGLLDTELGVYIHPMTREKLSIAEAMTAGFIQFEVIHTTKMQESTMAVGLVTINVIRESRPYTIRRVRHPSTEEEISVAEAVDQGIFDPQRAVWINPMNNEQIGIKNAIDAGLLLVEYDETEDLPPEILTKTFAVYGVLDRAHGRRYPFYNACEKGLIFKEEGEFYDSKTGKRLPIIDAAKNGWVKMRAVEDESQLERFVSRDRSASLDSVQATSFG